MIRSFYRDNNIYISTRENLNYISRSISYQSVIFPNLERIVMEWKNRMESKDSRSTIISLIPSIRPRTKGEISKAFHRKAKSRSRSVIQITILNSRQPLGLSNLLKRNENFYRYPERPRCSRKSGNHERIIELCSFHGCSRITRLILD